MFDVWNTVRGADLIELTRPPTSAAIGSDGNLKSVLYRSIDRALETHLIEQQFGFSVPTATDHPSNDRWLHTSAMQKAIRRGQARRAEQHALATLRLDEQYLFRRLAVCALEDVGMGDLLAVAVSLYLMTWTARKQFDAPQLTSWLTKRLAIAPKSRAACDLLSLVDYENNLRNLAISDQRQVELLQASLNPRDQMLGLWLSVGTRAFRSNVLPAGLGGKRCGIGVQLIQHGSPLILQYIAERAVVGLRDPMALAIVPLWRHLADRPDFWIEERPLGSSPDIEGFAAESIDMHCRPGRRALQEYGATCEPVRKLLINDSVTCAKTALSFAVFIVEGGISATTVREPTLDGWKAMAQDAELRFGGVASPQQSDLLQAVAENLSQLNCCRARAIYK